MKTIAMKLLMPILCAIFLGGVFIGVISERLTSETILEAGRNDGLRAVHSLRDFVDLVISTAHLDLSALAAAPSTKRLMLGKEESHDLEQYMRELIERQPLYNSLSALDSRGTIVASTSGSAGGNRADREYFKAGMEGRNFISEVQTSRQTGELAAFISMPVRESGEGPVIGVVMAALQLHEVNVRYVAPVALLKSYGFAMIVNNAGKIIGHKDMTRLGQQIPEEVLRRFPATDTEPVVFEAQMDAAPSLLFVERSQATDWYSVVVCPVSDFYRTTDTLTTVIMGLVGITFFLLMFIVLVVVNGVTSALSTTISYAADVSRGDLDVPLDVARQDEVGVLARSLRDMVGTLKNMIAVAEQKTREAEQQAERAAQATQDAQRASAAKTDFLARMSHEMRTPMNAIIGMTAIAKAATADQAKKDYCLDKVAGASRHLLGVINDILDMSKIEANKFDLFPVEFSFEKMLNKVIDIINFRIEEKKQVFAVEVDPQIPRKLIADEQHLAQVLTNLLSNAVKFTPDGGKVHVDVRLEEKDDEGNCTLRFAVKDSGIGISKEQQGKLFSSFTQADGGVSRKFGGTGLGLAISKKIVEMMQGRIWVESELEQGAAFIFTMRAMRGAETRQSRLRPGVNWTNIRILMVDDDQSMLEYCKEVAQQIGIACDVAASGEEACGMIRRNGPYDLYFVDWHMPGMNGIELAGWIKGNSTEPSIVVMMSSAEWNDVTANAQAAGVDTFLSKPLFASTVVDCINTCLGLDDVLEESESEEDLPCFENYCLLLAEDVEINREIVQSLLEPTRIRMEFAEDGKQAVDMFSAAPERYDLIFMDIHMPEIDGYEATRRIRVLDCLRAREVPIVAMTANVFREDIERCIAVGMNAHVSKPLDIQQVIAVLRKHLADTPLALLTRRHVHAGDT